MFDVIKKQFVVFLICFIFSFIVCLLYPVKKELYLGIKNIFHSETILYPNDVITINYKRAQNNDNEFIVSGSNPVLVVNLNNKYIENITINFKEQLKENLQLKLYIEKEKKDIADNEVIKIKDIETLKENISYSAKINDFFKSFIFAIGEQIGDSFVVDNISYIENYKYYWNEIFHYNYLKQLKTKSYWLNILKLFCLFMLVVEYLVVRKYIYKRIGKTK